MEDLDAQHLISLVESNPVLWDKSREGSRERAKLREAWMIICAQLRDDFPTLSAPEQKEFARMIVKRWRNIRDQWIKWRKKHRNPPKYNPGCRAYRRRYVYHDQLQFLEKAMGDYDQTEMSQEEFFDHFAHTTDTDETELLLHIKRSASTESLRSSELEHERVEPQIEYITEHELVPDESAAKKRKTDSEFESSSEDDRHMMFFRSVVPYLKSFSERQILDFQMGVLQLVRTSMDPDPLIND